MVGDNQFPQADLCLTLEPWRIHTLSKFKKYNKKHLSVSINEFANVNKIQNVSTLEKISLDLLPSTRDTGILNDFLFLGILLKC